MQMREDRLAFVALIALATWVFIALPLIYLPDSVGIPTEILGVKPGEWLLSAATVGLWYATWRLVKGSEKTAERQLRAYIFVGARKAPSLEVDAVPELELFVKNVGQTPAHRVQHWTNMGILPYPLNIPLPGPDPRNKAINAYLPVGGEFEAIHTGNPPLDAEAVATIRAGSAYRLYVWGEVRYLDVFNVERKTKFRFMQGGANFRPNHLEICEEGNVAD
jgi:hypothetical protein